MKGEVKHGTELITQQGDKSFIVSSINETVREHPENNNKDLKLGPNKNDSQRVLPRVGTLQGNVRRCESVRLRMRVVCKTRTGVVCAVIGLT